MQDLQNRIAKGLRGQPFLLVVVLLGSLIRFYQLDQPQLWLDELIQLTRIHHESLWACLLDLKSEIAATPLDYLIQRQIVQHWGNTAAVARFHAAFFGCLALPCLYGVGRRLFPRQTCAVATILASVYPLHFFYSREARNYSLFFLLTLTSFWVLFRAADHPRFRWWTLHSLASILLLYTNYLASIVLISQGLLVLFLCTSQTPQTRTPSTRPQRPLWAGFCVSSTLAVTAFLPWLIWTYRSTQPHIYSAFWEPGLPLRIFKEISGGSYPLSLLLCLLLLLGTAQSWRSGNRFVAAMVVSWFFVPILLVLAFDWYGGYFFSIRQVIFATPPLLLGAAIGLDSASLSHGTSRVSLRIALVVLIIGLSLGTILLSDKKEQADWDGLAAHLAASLERDQWILAPLIERVVAYKSPAAAERLIRLEELDSVSPEPLHFLLAIESRYQTLEQRHALDELVRQHRLVSLTEIQGFRLYQLDFHRNTVP